MPEAVKKEKPFDPDAFIAEAKLLEQKQKEEEPFDPDKFIAEALGKKEPFRTKVSNYLQAGARGVVRSFEPAKGALEAAETLTNFVPIRIGEMLGRKLNPDLPKVPYTSLADVDMSRNEYTRNLEKKAPGVQFGSEMGATAASILPAFGEVITKGPSIIGKTYKGYKVAKAEKKAAQAQKKFAETTSEILGETDPQQISHIQQNVSRIEQLVKEGKEGKSGMDLTNKVRNELKDIQNTLGERVAKYRAQVDSDKTTQIPLQKVQNQLSSLLGSRASLSTGESLLTGKSAQDIETVASLLKTENRNPSDVLKITDRIDGMLQPERVAKDNISGEAVHVLQQVRRSLKDEIHTRFPGYAEVDAPFSAYKEAVENIEGKIAKHGGESYLTNLVNANKTEARSDLETALNLAKQSGNIVGTSIADDVFKDIKSIKTAREIIGKGDVKLDQADRVFNKYKDAFLHKTQMVGTGIGGLFGLAMGNNPGDLFGAGLASTASGYFGGKVAQGLLNNQAIKYGQRMASPDRIFEAAKKANQLSSEAKLLASEIQTVYKASPQKANEMIQYISALPAFQELSKFIQSKQEKK